jgi:hypothetical protein
MRHSACTIHVFAKLQIIYHTVLVPGKGGQARILEELKDTGAKDKDKDTVESPKHTWGEVKRT